MSTTTIPSNTNIEVHFSSATNEWATPQWLFDQLNVEFHFALDAAATVENAKCARYYTVEMDALKQDWGKDASSIWCNPPYGRLGPLFIAKGYEQTKLHPHLTTVFLIPARPDTRWWHSYCALGEVRFLKGRLKFESVVGPIREPTASVLEGKHAPNNAAPFPSAIIIFGAKAKLGTTSYVAYKESKTKA